MISWNSKLTENISFNPIDTETKYDVENIVLVFSANTLDYPKHLFT